MVTVSPAGDECEGIICARSLFIEAYGSEWLLFNPKERNAKWSAYQGGIRLRLFKGFIWLLQLFKELYWIFLQYF